MTVTVEWMDGKVKSVEDVEKTSVGGDGVLRLYGYLVGGRAPMLAEFPIFHIREIIRSGER